MAHVSLSELNKLIKNALSSSLAPSYWLVAEIGEMRLNQRGHCYLELIEKEDNALLAKNRATIWSYTYRNLSGWFEAITGESLKAGMNILCQVEVSYHELYGMSLNIKDIDAQYTLGERARKKQEVLDRLFDEGVLDMNKGLILPTVPQKVAVISSPTAAGLGDFLDQLAQNRYQYQFDIRLFKAMMQGNQAAESIVMAMMEVFQMLENDPQAFDVLVIIRGGGAQVDLDCFDTYELAAHIAQFPLPVVTGIGHERDETVADLVAHTKMKTPTAVAEFLIHGALSFDEKLENLWYRISQKARYELKEQSMIVDHLSNSLKYGARKSLQQKHYELQQAAQSLKYHGRQHIKSQADQLSIWKKNLQSVALKNIQGNQESLNHLQRFLNASRPENILQKGYSYTSINGKAVSQETEIHEGDAIETMTSHLIIQSTISNIKNREKDESQKEKN